MTPDPQPAGPILNPALIDPPLLVPYTTTVAPIPPLTPPRGAVTRNLTLNEDFDQYGRLRQKLGLTFPTGIVTGGVGPPTLTFGLDYLQTPTERPLAGAVEVWRIYNTTLDTHPIHFHIASCQVLSRQAFTLTGLRFRLTPGTARGPEPNEVGWKETVEMHPGEATTVVFKFDLPAVPFAVPVSPRTGNNEYVWHCHILEHEEHDMMRPLVVRGANPLSALAVDPTAQSITGLTGGTAVFKVSGGTKPYTVTSNNAAYAATLLLDSKGAIYGFSVTVPAGAAAASVIFTIKDAAAVPATVTATLNIV